MSLKIFHSSDLHYQPKRADEVFASLATLERESAERNGDLITIAGDLFNASVFNTGNTRFPEFVEAVRRLADVAPVALVYGTPSHDIAGSLAVFESLDAEYGITVLKPGVDYLLDSGRVYRASSLPDHAHADLLIFGIPEPHKGWLLAGREAMGKAESDEAMKEGMRALLLGLAAQRKQHPNIPCVVLYHGQIRGATMDNGEVIENALGRDDLALIGANYYALGDIHQPQQIGDLPAYYPGSVYPTTWGETHQAGFNVVTMDNAPAPAKADGEPTSVGLLPERFVATVERVDYPHPQQVKLEINLGGDSVDEVYERAVKLGSGDGKRVWVEVTGSREEIAALDDDQALRILMEDYGAAEGSRITVKITNTETVRAGEIAEAAHLSDKVLIYAENSGQAVSDTILAKCDELEEKGNQADGHDGAHIRLRKIILRGAIGIWKGQGLDEIEVDLDEYDPGLIGLLWANGGGKTTLIENMHPWPQLLTRGGKLAGHFRLRDSFRDLYFCDERAGDEYRALLQINGTSKAGEVECLLYRNGEPVTNGRKDPYVAAIDDLFGGLPLYLRSAFVSQKDAGLADSTNKERIEIVRELAGLDYIEDHAEEAKARGLALAGEISTAEGWIKATEEHLLVLPDLRTALGEKRKAVAGGEEAVRKIEESGNALRTEHDLMAEKVEANKARLRESRELTVRADTLSLEAKELTEKRLTWARASDMREDAEARIANWEELEGERKKLEASRNEKIEKRSAALEAYNTARAAFDGERRTLETAQRDAETALEALRNDRARAKDAIEAIGEALDVPRHDKCPKCGATLPWVDDEDARRAQQQAAFKAAQETVYEDDKKLPAAEDAVETAAAALRALKVPEEPVAQRMSEDAELERIADDQQYLNIAGARQTVDRAKEADIRIEEIDARLAAIATERHEIDQRQDELYTEININLDARFDELTRQLEDARRQHTEARETLSALNAEAGALTKQIDDLERTAGELALKQTEVAEKRRDADEWAWLHKALGRTGVQALELDALAPSIEDAANRLLQAAYGSRFSIRFQTTRMDSTGKRQLETFDIQIADTEHGDEQELSTLSGGEAVWLRRALYDAFGIVRARNTGLRFLTVFADESDGALDPESREQYARMIEAAHAESGRHHTIMITHSAEVQEMLAQRIDVTERIAPAPATEGVA